MWKESKWVTRASMAQAQSHWFVFWLCLQGYQAQGSCTVITHSSGSIHGGPTSHLRKRKMPKGNKWTPPLSLLLSLSPCPSGEDSKWRTCPQGSSCPLQVLQPQQLWTLTYISVDGGTWVNRLDWDRILNLSSPQTTSHWAPAIIPVIDPQWTFPEGFSALFQIPNLNHRLHLTYYQVNHPPQKASPLFCEWVEEQGSYVCTLISSQNIENLLMIQPWQEKFLNQLSFCFSCWCREWPCLLNIWDLGAWLQSTLSQRPRQPKVTGWWWSPGTSG